MAILKDLIVHGSSRFLNKIYAEELEASAFEAESAIIKKLKADDVTVVGLLDVQGQLHTSNWTNSNIATIDGSFYITPTIECVSGTLSSLTVNASTPPKHSFVLTAASGSSFAVVNSLYYYDTSAHTVTWAKYSKVLITGEILVGGEWIPLGTILGQLNGNGASDSISIFNGQNNKHGTSTILAELTSTNITNAEFRNLKISLYQRSGNTTTNTDAYKYPLGIYLTALGQNGKTFIDIYGGGNSYTTQYGGYALPNVRIGNLSGLSAVEGTTPQGWGIYTTNGYFKGVIVSSAGKIGNFTINSALYSNNHSAWNSNVSGIYINNDGISGGAGGKWWLWNDGSAKIGEMTLSAAGVLTVPAANVSGELTAATINGSKITANTITASQIATNAITADELAANAVTSVKIKAGEVKADNIAANAVTAGKISVDNLSAITANLGTIRTGVIKHDTVGGTNGIWLSADTNTSSNITVGNSTARNDWRLLVNNKFGVTSSGDLYASNANITGTINATNGNIGGIEITDGSINGENFGINEDGSMYIVGTINATEGRIGNVDIVDGKLSLSEISLGDLKDADNYIENNTKNYVQKEEFQNSKKITTYYLASSKSTGVTFEDEGWSLEVPSIDENDKYLWAYQVRKGEEINVKDNIVSFENNGDQILFDNLIVDINPVQSGSGDPSPTNVRPISGWTGVTAQRTGKNLADAQFGYQVPSVTNGQMVSANGWSTDYIAVDNSKDYVFSYSSSSTAYVFFYGADYSYLGNKQISTGVQKLSEVSYYSNTSYVKLRSDSVWNSDPLIQLEEDSTATDYEPYNGNTYSVDWQTEAGTVYGGTIDVVNGLLMVDRAMVDLGTLNWVYKTGSAFGNYFYGELQGIKFVGEFISVTYPIISSHYKTTPRSSVFVDKCMCVDGVIAQSLPTQVQIKDSAYTDAATFKTAMNGVQLVYELATPITYQLTPTEVKSLIDQNHVWADCGDVELTYSTNASRGNSYLIGVDDVKDTINSIQTNVNDLSSTVSNYLGAWITLGTQEDDNGNEIPIMRLGSSSDPLSPKIQAVFTNEKLDFRVNNNSVAYIGIDTDNTGKLFATNSLILSEMQFGNWAWYQRENGHLSVKWKGGSNS